MAKNRSNGTEKMIQVRLPRDSSKSARQFVSVGDRNWLIKRGETVTIPECAYEVLCNSELAEDAAVSYIESAPVSE